MESSRPQVSFVGSGYEPAADKRQEGACFDCLAACSAQDHALFTCLSGKLMSESHSPAAVSDAMLGESCQDSQQKLSSATLEVGVVASQPHAAGMYQKHTLSVAEPRHHIAYLQTSHLQ